MVWTAGSGGADSAAFIVWKSGRGRNIERNGYAPKSILVTPARGELVQWFNGRVAIFPRQQNSVALVQQRRKVQPRRRNKPLRSQVGDERNRDAAIGQIQYASVAAAAESLLAGLRSSLKIAGATGYKIPQQVTLVARQLERLGLFGREFAQVDDPIANRQPRIGQ